MTRKRQWILTCTAGAVACGLVAVLWVSMGGNPPLVITAPEPHVHTFVPEAEPPALPPLDYFHDVTGASGVDFTCRNGEEAGHYAFVESLGGGVALFDFDGDGLVDIFLVGGGTFAGADRKDLRGLPCKLYKNLGNWKFADVTAAAGLDAPPFYAHGCAVADYDRDGWPDLLVTGHGGLALYHNVSAGTAGRRFVEVAQSAGLDDRGWCTSAAWADLDGDGYPDLYVCRYVDWSWQTHKVCAGDDPSVKREICPPGAFRGAAHRLYRNRGDGTFAEVGAAAGLRQGEGAVGMGLGVIAVDLDGDGRPDVYAVNDTTENFLYQNDGGEGRLLLRDVALPSGVAFSPSGRPDGSMGVDAADYDGSGRPSLWITTFERERHALYRNRSTERFVNFDYMTWPAGIAVLGTGYVGFGTAFVDVDNDGWEDLVIAHGHVRRHATRAPLAQKPVLFYNAGTGRFLNATKQGGTYFQSPHRGRGLAVADLDNDGRPDLVIAHLNEPVALLRNDPRGPDVAAVPRHHWLGLELLGRKHRDVVGARVVIDAAGRRLTRFVKGGGSYLSASDRRLLIGLADADQIERVTVFWPWGGQQQWHGLAVDHYWQLVEGDPAARRR